MKKVIWAVLSVVLVICLTCFIYLNDYYKCSVGVNLTAFETKDNYYELKSDSQTKTGLIFYPGGKVDELAYVPLLEKLSDEGILCILVKMPFRLAVFDNDAADKIIDEYPEIENWYMAGHSLGGAMAASYLQDNCAKFDGLILLGAYSPVNLKDKNLKILSVYGSNDGIMQLDKYEKYKENLGTFTEKIIEGGIHSYFGDYGLQKGDGKALISRNEQYEITVESIVDFIR